MYVFLMSTEQLCMLTNATKEVGGSVKIILVSIVLHSHRKMNTASQKVPSHGKILKERKLL